MAAPMLALALAASGPAHGDAYSGGSLVYPSPQALAAAVGGAPTESGRVYVECRLAADGTFTGCRARVATTPALGATAERVAALYRVEGARGPGPAGGTLYSLRFGFRAGYPVDRGGLGLMSYSYGDKPLPEGFALLRPSGDQFRAALPRDLPPVGSPIMASALCTVDASGAASQCRPAGSCGSDSAFAAAAVRLAGLWHVANTPAGTPLQLTFVFLPATPPDTNLVSLAEWELDDRPQPPCPPVITSSPVPRPK